MAIPQIQNKDALQRLKEQPDYSADLIFCDPPYALGSEITIRKDGKPDYSKAVDFMNKWEMPDGKFWEEFYKEAFRVLKFGGHCVMYGMDRQNFMFKYYGHLAGFTGKQSLYWYFISNFPKASDLSKMIDKNAGAEREVIGKYIAPDGKERWGGNSFSVGEEPDGRESSDLTAPSTPLAKKYSGYKYSVAPLKQVVEEIMVFQKPMKTGSVLHDTLAMENGDESITCGALDIDGNRVETSIEDIEKSKRATTENHGVSFSLATPDKKGTAVAISDAGRYPAQAFLTGTEEILDEQSGIHKEGNGKIGGINSEAQVGEVGFMNGKAKCVSRYPGEGGCSKVLHKCPYETEEYDLFNYNPKVSKAERNAGCEGMKDRISHLNSGGIGRECSVEKRLETNGENAPTTKNNHPTLKPISLNHKILSLFKTPDSQKILIPFAGSGSEIIGAIKAGFEDIEGAEINPQYVEIAEARIEYRSNKFKGEQTLFN